MEEEKKLEEVERLISEKKTKGYLINLSFFDILFFAFQFLLIQ